MFIHVLKMLQNLAWLEKTIQTISTNPFKRLDKKAILLSSPALFSTALKTLIYKKRQSKRKTNEIFKYRHIDRCYLLQRPGS